MTEISVLISTYHGEDPDDVDICLETTYTQSRQPDEVVIVEDGPLPSELQSVVDTWRDRYPDVTKIISFEENRGTGAALKTGLSECTGELVAKVDSDDFSHETRLERQLQFLNDNPGVAAVGGYMREILPDGSNRVRKVPESPEEIRSYAKYRSPINHPTSMYRREVAEAVGGYRDLRSMQDYDLWVRMLNDGYVLVNLPEVLVESRVDEGWYARRGGIDYAKLELKLLLDFVRMGFLNKTELLKNVIMKSPVRLAPGPLREYIYSRHLRD